MILGTTLHVDTGIVFINHCCDPVTPLFKKLQLPLPHLLRTVISRTFNHAILVRKKILSIHSYAYLYYTHVAIRYVYNIVGFVYHMIFMFWKIHFKNLFLYLVPHDSSFANGTHLVRRSLA